MQKILGFWKKVDPYKDYVPVEKHPKLIALQIGALCICCFSFFVFLAFSIDAYSKTPEPSKASVERVFPSNPPKALFQFTLMLPLTSRREEVRMPTFYRSPLSDVLTVKKAVEYTLNITKPMNPEYVYQFEAFAFPVYGTVDPTTRTSTLLYFQPAIYRNSVSDPLLFAVGPPGIVFSRLDVKEQHSGINHDLILSDPNSNTQFIQMYESLNGEGPEIHIEMALEKTVSSNSEVSYTASFSAPPLLTPKTNENISPQRFISISVKSNVNVMTFSAKNIFTFLGSIGGIFPIFVTIGGIIASLLWSRTEQKTLDASSIEPKKNIEMRVTDTSVEMRSFKEEPFDKGSSSRFERIETHMNRFEARFKSFETEQAEILGILQDLSNTINGRAMQEVAASDAVVSETPHRAQARVIDALSPQRYFTSKAKLLAPRASAQQGSHAGNSRNVSLPDALEIPQTPSRGRSRSRGRYAGNDGARDA
jgi:hypothetical protein